MFNTIYQSHPDASHRHQIIARWLGNETDIAYLKVAEQLDRIFHERSLPLDREKAILPISDSFMRKACGVQGGRNTPRTFNWITVRDQAHHRLKRAERGGARGGRSDNVSQYAIYGIGDLFREFTAPSSTTTTPERQEMTDGKQYLEPTSVVINRQRLIRASRQGALNRVIAEEVSAEELRLHRQAQEGREQTVVRYSPTTWEYRNAAWTQSECAMADRIARDPAGVFRQRPFLNTSDDPAMEDGRVYYTGDSIQGCSRRMREAMLDSFTDIDINAAVFAVAALLTDMRPGPVVDYLRDKKATRNRITREVFGFVSPERVRQIKAAVNSLCFGARATHAHPEMAITQTLGYSAAQHFVNNRTVQALTKDLESRMEQVWPRSQFASREEMTRARFFGFTRLEAALREVLMDAVRATAHAHARRKGTTRNDPDMIHMHDGVMVLEPISGWSRDAAVDIQALFRMGVGDLVRATAQEIAGEPRDWCEDAGDWLTQKATSLITVDIQEWEDPVAATGRKTRALK